MKFRITSVVRSVLQGNSDFMNKIEATIYIPTLHSQLNNSFLLGCGFYRDGQRGGRRRRN